MDVDMKIQYPDLAGDTPLTEVICYGAVSAVLRTGSSESQRY